MINSSVFFSSALSAESASLSASPLLPPVPPPPPPHPQAEKRVFWKVSLLVFDQLCAAGLTHPIDRWLGALTI